jgi:BirA family transcriptional regulator, biotin operon repressor / biotin---[acetyl-CoA-carboxylase] ligase
LPHLPTHQPIGTPFIELLSVNSTNNYARQQIHGGLAQHGMAIFTHEQVAGKGQRGKKWASEKGMNMALSIIVNPQPLLLAEQFQLSACVAVAAHDFFSQYTSEDATKIKWPNDLYWQDRKAGGILIESGVGSRESGVNTWQWAIVGIGININQTSFPADLPNPVSLKQITGKNFTPLELAKELCTAFDKRFSELTGYLKH